MRGATWIWCASWGLFLQFLSTLPVRGATHPPSADHRLEGHFYPRSPRGERRPGSPHFGADRAISIHAPREGSDLKPSLKSLSASNFYPRSPRGERLLSSDWIQEGKDFYPRSPRGERLLCSGIARGWDLISIHAPREGSDNDGLYQYPTPDLISIHAPREGSDPMEHGEDGNF